MSDRKHAELMLDKAETDLRAVRGMGDAEQFADEIFGFHAQQAVEKALKGWLSLLGVRFPKVHDLDLLIDLLERHGVEVAELRKLGELSAFAVELRYDHAGDEVALGDRSTVIDQVAGVVNTVRNHLAKSG